MNESRLREILEMDKCDSCKTGDFSNCCNNRRNAMAFIENEETGKRKYFCTVGCALLYLLNGSSLEEIGSVVERQFNVEGHYEKMIRG